MNKVTALTEDQLDALKEIVNIGVGKAASILNEMLDSHIELDVPSIEIFNPEDATKVFGELSDNVFSSVRLDFHGVFEGASILVFPPVSAEKLVTALTGEEPDTAGINAVMAGTLNEIGNIVINAVMGSIANLLSNPILFSLPNYIEGKLIDLLKPADTNKGRMILLVKARFMVEVLKIDGNIFLIFELDSFGDLISAIDDFMKSHG